MHYKEIAYKYLPIEVQIKIIPQNGIKMNGWISLAYAYEENDIKEIGIPEIKTKKIFLDFIHECGHIKFKHAFSPKKGTADAWQLEIEANEYVKNICEKEKISLSSDDMAPLNHSVSCTRVHYKDMASSSYDKLIENLKGQNE